MNEQNVSQSNEPVQKPNNIGVITISVILTALIVGSIVYAWQNSNAKSIEQSLQQQITQLQSQISQLRQDNSLPATPSKPDATSNDELSDESDVAPDSVTENTPSYQIYQERPYDDLQPHESWGYEFNYPQEFTLENGDHPNYQTGSFLKTHQSGAGVWSAPIAVSVRLDDAYAGTNFKSAWLTVAYDSDITTLENCQVSDRNSMAEKLTDTQTIHGVSWYKGVMSSAAAGTSVDSRIYHTLHNGMCYEVNLHIATTNIGNYDPSLGITAVNEDEVWSKLENIMSTFEFIE